MLPRIDVLIDNEFISAFFGGIASLDIAHLIVFLVFACIIALTVIICFYINNNNK